MNRWIFFKYFRLLIFTLFLPSCNSYINETIQEYYVVIIEADNFRSNNSRLPSDEEFNNIIKNLGFEANEGCPCYSKESDDDYIIWFGLESGESMVYSSKSKKWERRKESFYKKY